MGVDLLEYIKIWTTHMRHNIVYVGVHISMKLQVFKEIKSCEHKKYVILLAKQVNRWT